MRLQEKGRVIREEGPETVLPTLYIGLLLAVDYKYRRQETTKKRRQFPVGSVVSTGVNPDGHNAAGNWQNISAAASSRMTMRPTLGELF
jgi:hypothetical protein